LAGWLNRLNEIRERLRCSYCGHLMKPRMKYAKNLARYNATVVNCDGGVGHDHDIYLNHCWACRVIIDSPESPIRVDGFYLCVHCGSGNAKSNIFTKGDGCPKCGAPEMRTSHRKCVCVSCQHTIRLPADHNLTGPRAPLRSALRERKVGIRP